MLVVVEYGNVEHLAQALLDDETLRRLDVLEVDAAEGEPHRLHRIDEFVRILGTHFDVEGIDVGEALEENGLAFHHRLRGERAEIAETENGGAVRDHADEVALCGVVEGAARVFGNGEHGYGDAGGVGERKIALRRHRLGRDDFELSGPSGRVKLQRFLIGECRPRIAALLLSHTLLPGPGCVPGPGP